MKQPLLILATGAMAATLALAQTTPPPAAPPPGARAHMHHQMMMQALDLTAAQKEQAKTIWQNTRQQTQPLVQQLKQDRQSLNAAIKAGDTAQIQLLSAKMGNLHGQVLAIRSAGKAKFYAMLTPEQKAKEAEFREKAHQGPGSRNE